MFIIFSPHVLKIGILVYLLDPEMCKKWEYKIKSTYHFCISNILNVDYLTVNGSWNAHWKLKVPQKLKKKTLFGVFVATCLPNRCRIVMKRDMVCPIGYALCDSGEEDNLRLFFMCQSSEQCWVTCGYCHDVHVQWISNCWLFSSFGRVFYLLHGWR